MFVIVGGWNLRDIMELEELLIQLNCDELIIEPIIC